LDIEFIQSPHAWDYFAERIHGATLIAISTEDASLHSYRGELCLLQLHAVDAAGATVGLAMVDVLGTSPRGGAPSIDLRPFEGHPVVVHGGEYTVASLKRHLQWDPQLLSDTQQAANLLGLQNTGYRNLCKALLGVELGPAPSVDWRRRPLEAAHIHAAVDDVRHLPALWRVLERRIRAADLTEECALAARDVAATPPSVNRAETANAWRSREARALPRSRWALFEALLAWRERKAREFDLPPGRLVPNRALAELAARGSVRPEAIDGFHSRLTWPDREEVQRIFAALAEAPAVATGPATAPMAAGAPPSREDKARLAALKRWRQAEAAERGVGLQAVLPGAVMHLLARGQIVTEAAIAAMGGARWRRYGPALTRILSNPSPVA
jgi:ribonuclease D